MLIIFCSISGRRVIIMRPGCYDHNIHKAEDIEKANFMISDIMGFESEQMFVTGMQSSFTKAINFVLIKCIFE